MILAVASSVTVTQHVYVNVACVTQDIQEMDVIVSVS